MLNIISNYFGVATIVQKITPNKIEQFKEYLMAERKAKNSTVNHYLTLMSKMFNIGIDNGIIRNNPLLVLIGEGIEKSSNFKIKSFTKAHCGQF